MYCNACGNKLEPNTNFCNRCGTPVKILEPCIDLNESQFDRIKNMVYLQSETGNEQYAFIHGSINEKGKFIVDGFDEILQKTSGISKEDNIEQFKTKFYEFVRTVVSNRSNFAAIIATRPPESGNIFSEEDKNTIITYTDQFFRQLNKVIYFDGIATENALTFVYYDASSRTFKNIMCTLGGNPIEAIVQPGNHI